MTINELSELIRDANRAFKRLGLEGRSNDLSLSHEVRLMAIALDDGKFDKAFALTKELSKTDS